MTLRLAMTANVDMYDFAGWLLDENSLDDVRDFVIAIDVAAADLNFTKALRDYFVAAVDEEEGEM